MFVRILIPLISVLVSLLASEFILRFSLYGSFTIPKIQSLHGYRIPHTTRGWALKPNASAVVHTPAFHVHVKTNSKGFRDNERSYEKGDERKRVVVLGDSYMEAYQVSFEDSFPQVLESELGKESYEVINLGTGGYGTVQEFLTFREEGVRYKPDVVILAIYLHNDIRNNSLPLEIALRGKESSKTYARPFLDLSNSDELTFTKPDIETYRLYLEKKNAAKESNQSISLKDDSIIGKMVMSSLASTVLVNDSEQGYDPNIHFGPAIAKFSPEDGIGERTIEEYQSMWSEGWEITHRVISELAGLTHSLGAKLLVMGVPLELEYNDARLQEIESLFPNIVFDSSLPHKKLREGLPEGVSFIDLLPEFTAYYRDGKGSLTYQPYDRHWNGEGHRIAAALVAEVIFKVNSLE